MKTRGTLVLDAQSNKALITLLTELVDGAASDAAYVLNRGDGGLLLSLDRLTAKAASTIGPQGGVSIAAHTDHLRYGLSLMNRWSHGENPFADADWGPSWERSTVSEQEWAERRAALKAELYAWREAIRQPREVNAVEAAGILGSVVHRAYHLGAIRQMDRSIRGPLEEERAG